MRWSSERLTCSSSVIEPPTTARPSDSAWSHFCCHRCARHQIAGYISLRLYLDRPGRAAEEKGAEVSHDDVRNLQRGIVPTGVELRPVHDVGIVALGKRSDGLEVVGKDGDTDASLAYRRLGTRVTFAVVVAHRVRGSVGEPVQRHLREHLLYRHQAGSIAEVLEQLVVCQLTCGRIRQRGGDRLGSSAVHLVVAAHRLKPAEKLQGGVLLWSESLEFTGIPRGEGEQLEHVSAQKAGRIQDSQLTGDHRAAVASMSAVRLVPEPAHQGVVRLGDSCHRPALTHERCAEPIAGRGWNDDVEGVLRSSAMSYRIG